MKQTTDQILEELDVKTALQRCTKANYWDLSNQILYNLCSQYPKHTDPGQIVAKVLMIGRVYTAALERIKEKTNHISDVFYLEAIVPLFETSAIDQKLATLKGKALQDSGVFLETLTIHAYLVKIISSLESETKYLKKRTFAFKYLHFHEPELFLSTIPGHRKRSENSGLKHRRSKNSSMTINWTKNTANLLHPVCNSVLNSSSRKYSWITDIWTTC